MLARASALPTLFFGPAQLGLLPLSVDRVDGAARAMRPSATEKNIKDVARSFFIRFGLTKAREFHSWQLDCQCVSHKKMEPNLHAGKDLNRFMFF